MANEPLIRNRANLAQVCDFRSLRFGKITPTDIDGLIDFGGRLWVVFELKYVGASMPRGQELAFERLCDALACTAPTVGFVAQHMDERDIDCGKAEVVRIRENGCWRYPSRVVSLREAVEFYRSRHHTEAA